MNTENKIAAENKNWEQNVGIKIVKREYKMTEKKSHDKSWEVQS